MTPTDLDNSVEEMDFCFVRVFNSTTKSVNCVNLKTVEFFESNGLGLTYSAVSLTFVDIT